MKRLISFLLISTLLLSGCRDKKNTASTDDTSTSSVETETQVEDDFKDAEENTTFSNGEAEGSSEDFVEETPNLEFMSLNDRDLLQYVTDNVYANLENELDTNEYKIENINAVYLSQEYIEELAYNSQSNIYFGYTLSELDDMFQGTKYVFTMSDDGTTTVEPLTEFHDNTNAQMLKNVVIGSGVILVCVTVSVVSAGVGAPAVAAVFAASAKTGTAFALSSGAISGISAAIIRGYQTKDMDEALQVGALAASEGFKWGAITGAIVGGAKEAFAIKNGNKIHTPRESEADVLSKYGGEEQISYLNGEKVGSGVKGSTRPDIVKQVGNKLEAIEVKNYDLKNNKSLLLKSLKKEISDRVTHMPSGTLQRIVLDVRGRGYSEAFLNSIIKEIQSELMTIYPNIPIDLLRW